MYKLKEKPEDFIVKEISDLELKDSDKYPVFVMKKRNYTTMRAVEQIAKELGIKNKEIGFAGIKDKNALTEQFISIRGIAKKFIERVKLKDIELVFAGYLDKPISLGDLKGNEFIITVRDLKKKDILNLKAKTKGKCLMPNYYGEQRFSNNNVEIGRLLLKSDFKKALKLILETNPDYKNEMMEHIKESPNDFVGALKLTHIKLLMLYARAYQSHLWNKILDEYIKCNKKNIGIPLVGFGTEIDDVKIEKIVDKVMSKEEITLRGFINRSIPEISLEGDLRDAFVEIQNFKVLEVGKDFVKIKFELKKASYATEAVKFLFK